MSRAGLERIERMLFGWRATEAGGGVRLDPLIGAPIELVPAAGGCYRAPWESGSSACFARSREGVPVMVAGGFAYAEAAAWWPARVRVVALAIAWLLLHAAPLWALGAYALAALRRRPVASPELVLWPALAGLCAIALPHLFIAAANEQVLGVVHPLTVAFFAATLVLAVASIWGLAAALGWSVRGDRPPAWRRLVPTACAAAAFGFTVWLAANGIIGLRTWAY